MAGKKKHKLYGYAEHLHVNEGWTFKAIADYLNLTEKTVGNWAKDGNWEHQRSMIMSAPHKIKMLLLNELEKVAKGEKTQIDADSLSKISKAIEALDNKVSIQIIFSVFTEFDMWMVEQDPATAMKFTDYHKKFILHKINTDGQ